MSTSTRRLEAAPELIIPPPKNTSHVSLLAFRGICECAKYWNKITPNASEEVGLGHLHSLIRKETRVGIST